MSICPERAGLSRAAGKYNRDMFFRRKRPREVTFQERLEALGRAGFAIESLGAGRVRIVKDTCAAEVQDVPGGLPRIDLAGVLVGGEIGLLVDGGYQKFLRTSSGKKAPALATDLKSLHDFQEDLREALGQDSLYNQSLGTTCDLHAYDRLDGRG